MTLERLRQRLTELDGELIDLVAARQRIVAEIGAHKLQHAVPTRDYEREREVLKGARERAAAAGIDTGLAEALMQLLIRASLMHQEGSRVAAQSTGAGKRALVIGGMGKMGRWFVRFLASQEYAVEVADPTLPSDSPDGVQDWRTLELDQDVIIVATPIKVTATVLNELADRRPAGLIIEIGSLKTPLRDGLKRLANSGCRISSIHPMFGPETRLLSGRHVIFVETGASGAGEDAGQLFDATMAERVHMSLDEHDRLIAYVLGLSHALNIAFFGALANSGELVPRLQAMSSTTFDAQLDVSRLVAHDNPHLYFEIQTLNEYGVSALEALRDAVDNLLRFVNDRDENSFVELMRAGREYLGGHD